MRVFPLALAVCLPVFTSASGSDTDSKVSGTESSASSFPDHKLPPNAGVGADSDSSHDSTPGDDQEDFVEADVRKVGAPTDDQEDYVEVDVKNSEAPTHEQDKTEDQEADIEPGSAVACHPERPFILVGKGLLRLAGCHPLQAIFNVGYLGLFVLFCFALGDHVAQGTPIFVPLLELFFLLVLWGGLDAAVFYTGLVKCMCCAFWSKLCHKAIPH